MSNVTNIIIIHDWHEAYRRKCKVIDEINDYFDTERWPSSKRRFLSIGDGVQVGGDRCWEGQTYMAALNYLDLTSFMRHIHYRIEWRKPERVKVLVQEQHESSFKDLFRHPDYWNPHI